VFNFSWLKCRKWESLGHCFELVVLLVMLGICLAMGPLLQNKMDDSDESAFGSAEIDSVLIKIVSVAMVVLTVATMAKVLSRWRRANSIIGIRPNNDALARPVTSDDYEGVVHV
jgi:hypothetical protein